MARVPRSGGYLDPDQPVARPGRPVRDWGHGPDGDGWFPDPLGENDERYWDGVGWTGYVQAVRPRRLKNVHYRIAIGACIVWGIAMIAMLPSLARGIDAAEAGKPEPLTTAVEFVGALVLLVAPIAATAEFIVGLWSRRAQRRHVQGWKRLTVAPPGWYRDPERPEQACYWDGHDWVRSVRQ